MDLTIPCIAMLVLALAHPVRADPADDTPPRATRRWGRITLGTAGLAAIGEAWYRRNGAGTNSDDFAFPSAGAGLWAKVTGDGFRFDGDGFDTNGLKHPLFGFASYALARENGFGALGAFSFASLTSLAWETFGELREYGAINDLLLTSTSGVPLGETLHLMLHEPAERRLEVRLGVGEHFEHSTSSTYGVLATRGAAGSARHRRTHWMAELPYDDSGRRGLVIFAQTDFPLPIVLDPWLYVVTSFDYRRAIERPDEDWDLHAVVKAGPGAELTRSVADTDVSAHLELTVETGEETAHAYPRWRAAHPDSVTRSTEQLNPHGYYHGAGVGGLLRVDARRGRTSGGACLQVSGYRALPGTDQFEETITAHPALTDVERRVATWLNVDLGRVSLGIDLASQLFAARAGEFRSVVAHNDAILHLDVSL